MVVLDLQETRRGDFVFVPEPPAPAETLLDVVREVVWFADECEETPEGIRTSLRNLLMFLSDVRERKFKRGIFLSARIMACAAAFRHAAACVAQGGAVPDFVRQADGWHALWRPVGDADAFFTDALMRMAGHSPLETGAARAETVHDAWLAALRTPAGRVEGFDDAVCEDFARHVKTWLSPLALTSQARTSFSFVLVPPETATGTWRLKVTTPQTYASMVALGQAAALFPPLTELRDGAVALRVEDVERFFSSGADTLSAAGFSVVMPEGLRGEHIHAEAQILSPDESPARGIGKEGGATARLRVYVDGCAVDETEIRFLLDQHTPFVFFRGRWIEVDRFALKEALKALEDAQGRRLSVQEAVSFSLGMQRAGRLRIEKARAHGWLRGLLNELHGDARFRVLPPPAGLKARLRDYQARGVAWLSFLTDWGFGPLLADDMGLGKTLQAIAWILHFKARSGGAPARVLVLSPVSVTVNWMRELSRFAPSLDVYLHQGPSRAAGATFRRRVRKVDVVVSGYSLLVRDFSDFSGAGFSALVLDEAQIIKNPDARVSKAARALGIPVRMALTGTPFENAVLDLWALQEFLNPGLLGTRRDFVEVFAKSLGDHANTDAACRLRRILEPFLLRRLKTDRTVAAELGEKREVREYCPLTADQRRDYESALASYRDDATAGGGPSRGRVLALLTRLKHICDGENKMARLVELLETIFEAGESALVFTQYTTVAREIRARLKEEFGCEYPFLHGGLTPERRLREIDAFTGSAQPNAFILSLKAGGYGLNLTRATHVIHFDRWWNPAVENQATDRAHRIGQHMPVLVHLFISPGTLEDHIDVLLEDKRRQAGDIVVSGESFLMKMNAEDFARTVALDGDGNQAGGSAKNGRDSGGATVV